MDWFKSKPIIQILEDIQIQTKQDENFLMSIQLVLRPDLDFRGFCGVVSSGSLNIGDKILVDKSNESALVKEIYVADSKEEKCSQGDAVTLVLDKEIDISRGDLITNNSNSFKTSKIINTSLIWFLKEIGQKNRSFLLKIGSKTVNATILRIKHKVDINNLQKNPAFQLEMNEIGECELALDEEIAFTYYENNKNLGSFILIDRVSNLTVAAGVINFKPRKSENVKWEETEIDIIKRNNLLGHESKLLWFTGISGSGKSTIANKLEIALHKKGFLTYLLDGDNLRHGLNRDLGFSDADRIENLRRVGEVSKLFVDAGVFTLASFISPFKKDRENIKSLFKENNFLEIYVKTDIEEAKKREPNGLYKKAIAGKIPNFTGIDSPYEEPTNPDITIDTTKLTPDEAVDIILKFISKS